MHENPTGTLSRQRLFKTRLKSVRDHQPTHGHSGQSQLGFGWRVELELTPQP